MCSNRECAEYFKSLNEYQRCFQELRKKWKSYGKAAGHITLKETSAAERRAIGGILGKIFYDETIRFSFAEFEQGLQKTRYAPVDMREVLEAYFGEKLSTNQGQREEEQKKKSGFLNRLGQFFLEQADSESMAFLWMQGLIAEKKYGYQLLIKEYGKDRDQAEMLAKNVGAALLKLERAKATEDESPLAVFAAEISGNPHYFDRGTSAGQLLVHAVCFLKKTEFPQNAHQWRELLLGAGIAPDNVSSMVHACGLRLRTENGWHPAYDAFCRLREPYVITMENLRGITGVEAAEDRVYVVENEMVFSYLLDHLKDKNVTMLCTSGQLRAAAQELIPLVLDAGARIYYSGDIDPDGIGIADRLWQKYGDRIHIWRMSPDDYENSLSGEDLGKAGASKLEHIRNPLLRKTAERIKEKQAAAYQENLLEDLLSDIRFDAAGIE